MLNKMIKIGKYVNTHGIKGEFRIKSNFKYKDKVFIKGMNIYIENKKYVIKTYRSHKEYDMVTLEGIDNINQILELKGSNVYFLRDDLKLNDLEFLDEDLIDFRVFMNNELKGKVDNIRYLINNKKLLIVNEKMVPFELIKKVDLKNKKIDLESVDGLL